MPPVIGALLRQHWYGLRRWGARVQLCVWLLELVLSAQIVAFKPLSCAANHGARNFKLYLQITGIATGMLCGPQIANLFLLGLDAAAQRALQRDLFFYRRMIDDVLIVVDSKWNGEQIAAKLDAWHECVHVTFDPDQNGLEAQFLDLQVSLNCKLCNGNVAGLSTCECCRVCWQTFFKPLNAYLYVPWSSLHAPHIKRSIVTSQVHRLKFTNKHDADFQKNWLFLSSKFRLRGYPYSVLQLCVQQVEVSKSMACSRKPIADYIVPFKFSYFDGANRVPFAANVKRLVVPLGFTQSEQHPCIYEYCGKTFRFVKSTLANRNQFVKRYARFNANL